MSGYDIRSLGIGGYDLWVCAAVVWCVLATASGKESKFCCTSIVRVALLNETLSVVGGMWTCGGDVICHRGEPNPAI